MAYRNGTYIAFHAEGNPDPTASDIRYYRMLKAWHDNGKIDFKFVNSHDKVQAVKDTASKAVIKASLELRLDNSKNMVLILGAKTKNDTDFVPHEIRYAVDTCKIPIFVAYTGYTSVFSPDSLSHLWPKALSDRILNGTAQCIHMPFQQKALQNAIKSWDVNNLPGGSRMFYKKEVQRSFGIHIP